MPRPARTAVPLAPHKGDFLRLMLGLTQFQWAIVLGTTANRVADAEASRRTYPPEVAAFDAWLDTYVLAIRQAPPTVPAPTDPAMPAGVPVPPPVPATSATLVAHLDTATHRAFLLRREVLRQRRQLHALQQVQAFRRAFLAALDAPPPQATAYLTDLPADRRLLLTQRLHRFRERLLDHLRLDDMPGGPLDPATLAYDALRLHLLEAEAATLRGWLDAA